MLALVYPNYQSGWDASNDYSNKDLLDAEDSVITDKVTVYNNGVLVYGTEPDGTKPDNTPTESTIEGDVNLSGKVDSADAVLMSKFLTGKSKLKTQALKNADLTKDEKVNVFDFVVFKRKFV